jgi:hypothetical protein
VLGRDSPGSVCLHLPGGVLDVSAMFFPARSFTREIQYPGNCRIARGTVLVQYPGSASEG